jgi:hypothetical protein
MTSSDDVRVEGGRSTSGPSEEPTGNRAARRSLIYGVVATLLMPTQFLTLIGMGFMVAGVVYGVLGLQRSFHGARGRWLAIAGLILCIGPPTWFFWWFSTGCGQGC